MAKQSEKVTSLDELAAAAAAVDGAAPVADPGAVDPQGAAPELPAGPAVDDASEAEKWARYPAIFGAVVARAMPELAPAYSDENCLAWGRAMVPIAKRRGWSPDGALGEWGALGIATAGFVLPTLEAVKARRVQLAADPSVTDTGAMNG